VPLITLHTISIKLGGPCQTKIISGKSSNSIDDEKKEKRRKRKKITLDIRSRRKTVINIDLNKWGNAITCPRRENGVFNL